MRTSVSVKKLLGTSKVRTTSERTGSPSALPPPSAPQPAAPLARGGDDLSPRSGSACPFGPWHAHSHTSPADALLAVTPRTAAATPTTETCLIRPTEGIA